MNEKFVFKNLFINHLNSRHDSLAVGVNAIIIHKILINKNDFCSGNVICEIKMNFCGRYETFSVVDSNFCLVLPKPLLLIRTSLVPQFGITLYSQH